MGWDHNSLNAPNLARIAEASGIRLVTVHGRTRQMFYTGTADWGFVAGVKAATRLPVIVNGDILGPEDAAEALRRSQADGVMIGRGAYGRPWLLRQVADYLMTGVMPEEPSLARQYAVLMQHYEAMLEHHGRDPGLRLARKHVAWYSKGLPGSAEFRVKINHCDTVEQAIETMRAFYEPLIEAGVEATRERYSEAGRAARTGGNDDEAMAA